MDTKKLRQKILDLAIRGKLVPQDPNDEPASVLLERIRAEKEQLIKEGKIKRSKKSVASDTSHYENVPFEVPESWCWTTLGEIGYWQAGATPSRMWKDYYGGYIPWLKSGDLTDGYIYEIPETITDKALEETSVKLNPTGSVLIAMYGATIGKIGILTFPATTNQACCACVDYKAVTPKYLFNFLLSHKEEFVKMGGGGAQPNISKEKKISTLIPIPPIAEQNRIADEIERLIAFIETIDLNQGRLEQSLKLCKERILDMALSGKLIPQDQDDEPAIELLRKINPSFTPADNRHYENVPKGWCFAKIKDIFIINPKNKANDYDMAGFVSMSMINEGYVDSYQYETREWSSIKAGFTHFQDGDIAVAKISPCLENRKSMILKGLPNGIGAGTTELHVFRSSIVDARYALYFFKSDYFIAQCIGTFNGVVGQQRVGKSVIEDIVFPLPPLEEQRRIACTISVIFKHLDNILSEL